MKNWTMVGLLVCAGLLWSCGPGGERQKASAQALADKWNGDFQKMQTSLEVLRKTVEDLYDRQDQLTLNVDSMDAPKGPYKYLNHVFYYKENDPDNAVVAATGAYPVDRELKKEILLLENAKPALMSIKKNSPATNISWIITVKSIGIGYPYFDFLSAIPQKLDLSQTFWFKMAAPELNPGKLTVWSKEPFAAMTGQGWYKTVAAPVYHLGQFMGIVSSDALIKEVVANDLRQSSDMIFVVTRDSLLLGATPSALKVLGLRVLEDFDYLKQMRENAFAPDSFRLNWEKNSSEITALGSRLKTLGDFDHKLQGKDYHFASYDVPVGGFTVVTFWPR